MKKLWIIIFLIPLFTVKIYANNMIFSWHDTIVEVPLGANIEAYLEIPNVTLVEGFSDETMYMIKNGVNYTFISVINTSVKKDYRLDYKVVSPKYNRSSIQTIIFRIVDQIPPVVTKGITIEVPVKTVSIDYLKYIDYEDNYDAKKDIVVNIDHFGVNLNQIGQYKVRVTLMDTSLNQTEYMLNVMVKDYQSPTIVEVKNPIINIGDAYDLSQFYIIKDNYDQSPTISYLDEAVDYQTLGIYPFSVKAKDQSGNETVLDSFIEIKDIEKPILSIKTNRLSLSLKQDFDLRELIVKLSDNYDVLSMDDVVIDTDLDLSQIGFYEAIFEVKDNSNNKTSVKVDIYVKDQEKPVFIMEDLSTYDYYDIDLMSNILVKDNSSKVTWRLIETNLEDSPGDYQALYLAIDQSGNHSYHIRNIKILSNDSTYSAAGMMIFYCILGLLFIGVLSYGYVYYRMKKRQM